jgi:hypothetical protein
MYGIVYLCANLSETYMESSVISIICCKPSKAQSYVIWKQPLSQVVISLQVYIICEVPWLADALKSFCSDGVALRVRNVHIAVVLQVLHDISIQVPVAHAEARVVVHYVAVGLQNGYAPPQHL